MPLAESAGDVTEKSEDSKSEETTKRSRKRKKSRLKPPKDGSKTPTQTTGVSDTSSLTSSVSTRNPWDPKPKRKSTRAGGEAPAGNDSNKGKSTRSQKKQLRGKVATTIVLPTFLSVLGKTYVSFILEAAILLFTFTFFFLLTYEMFFASLTTSAVGVVFLVDEFIYLFDIFLRLGVELWRYSSKMNCVFFIIPFSFKFYIMELIILFPYHVFFFIVGSDSLQGLAYYEWFYILRCLFLVRIYLMYRAMEDHSPLLVFLLQFFTVYLAFLHIVACVLSWCDGVTYVDHLLSRNQERMFSNATWNGHSKRFHPDVEVTLVDNYVHALLFSTVTIGTVGYTHPHAYTDLELVLASTFMLIGAIGMAGMFGSKLTSFLLELDEARYDMFHRVEAIMTELKDLGSTSIFKQKVSEYYSSLWNLREGMSDIPEIQSVLPPSVIKDILYDICTEMFAKSILFSGMEESFLRAVSRIVEVGLYNPDVIICLQGSPANTMYYILQGECMVKCKHNSNITAAILRAGCIIGETSLLLSMPHTVNVETKTVCQLLSIRKDFLMDICNEHLSTLSLMRQRFQQRLDDLTRCYVLGGEWPIAFVCYDDVWATWQDCPLADRKTVLRWAHGFNSIIKEDIIDESEATIIVDMPCPDPSVSKDKLIAYTYCVTPPTLSMTSKYIHGWHVFVLIVGTLTSIAQSYAMAFKGTSVFAYYMDALEIQMDIALTSIYTIDIFVEVLTACPVSGIYYKFRDGLRIKLRDWIFYCEVLSTVPLVIFHDLPIESFELEFILMVTALLFKCIKIVNKIVRYLNYLSNVHPNKIFWFRLIETLVMMIFCLHILACILFCLACSPTYHSHDGMIKCVPGTWIHSPYVQHLTYVSVMNNDSLAPITGNHFANTMPYLASLHFSASTITAVGFGDFEPRDKNECLFVVAAIIISFALTGYCTALLTSALSCVTRPTVYFQQKVVSIKQFIGTNGLSTALQDRIVEHYRLQQQYNRGVILPQGVHSFMFDAPTYMEQDSLSAALVTFLEGIPIFACMHQSVTIKIAESLIRTVLPPDIYFLRRGEVRRQMHFVYKGSVAVLIEETQRVWRILGASGHFGVRDLLFGEPAHNHVKTMSYCVIYSIDLDVFNEALGRDEEFMKHVEKIKMENEPAIQRFNRVYRRVRKTVIAPERKPTEIPSWIKFPSKDYPLDGKYEKEEFEAPYKENLLGKFLKCLLMKRTIHPAGTFALAWSLMLGMLSILLILMTSIQLYLYHYHNGLSYLMTFMRLFFFADIYVSMHWAYYTDSNCLVSHPAFTAKRYIFEGGLAYAFIVELVPYYLALLCLRVLGLGLHGEGQVWAAKFSLYLSLLRLPRVPIIVTFAHEIFKWRTLVLMILYIIITICLAMGASMYTLHMACPWDGSAWSPKDTERIPACLQGTWITKKLKTDVVDNFGARWIASMYYVCQTIFIVGYGDMMTFRKDEILVLVLLTIFGFVGTRIIISDITAASVDSDEIRANFAERIECLESIMIRQRVNKKLIGNVMDHLEHTWLISKGLQPQELLIDLHPALQADLFKEYIGDSVSRVPLLSGVSDNILRTVYTFMKKLYFRQGERIMRRGNMEFEMYIIVDGDVWIADKNMEYRCVLGPGECMGETQMIYGLQRRYSAIAANSVEVFSLSSSSLVEILERYPRFMNDLERNLYYKRDDLFERKIAFIERRSKELPEPVQKRVAQRVLQHSASIREAAYVREIPGFGDDEDTAIIETRNPLIAFLSRNVCFYGSRDDSLPFFYFAHPNENECAFLLHPNCMFQKLFNLLVLAVCLVSTMLSIYEIFLVPGNTFLVAFIVCECVYALHVLLQFITPFPTVNGKYCKQFGHIVFRYISELSRFWLDVASTIPVVLLITRETHHLRYLYVLHMLRMIYFFRTVFETRGSITTTTFRLNLTISLVSFALMVHLLACVFYGISPCDTSAGVMTCKAGTWSEDVMNWYINLIGDGTWGGKHWKHYHWYLRSLYYIICTVTTAGPGDIMPVNVTELAVTIVTVFCGAFVVSVILSLFTSGLTSRSKFLREHRYQVKLLKKYLGNIGLSQKSIVQLETWFNLFWQKSRGVPYRKSTRILPLSLQIDVNLALYYDTLKKVPLFADFDKRLFRQIANRLSHMIYVAGMTVANEGDSGNALLIVSRGRVCGYVLTRHGHARLIRWYNPGSCFGRLPALFYDQTYTKTYRCETNTDVLVLRQQDIYHLAQNFPAFATRLQKLIQKWYNPNMGTSTIFSPDEVDVKKKTKKKRKEKEEKRKARKNNKKARRGSKGAKLHVENINVKKVNKKKQEEEDQLAKENIEDHLEAHLALRLNKTKKTKAKRSKSKKKGKKGKANQDDNPSQSESLPQMMDNVYDY